jgi:hypothetical protein
LGNGSDNPDTFEVLVVVGANGRFIMHEDDGNGKTVDKVVAQTTTIEYHQAEKRLVIMDGSNTPRTWRVRLLGHTGTIAEQDRSNTRTGAEGNGLLINLSPSSTGTFELHLGPNPIRGPISPYPIIYNLSAGAQIEYESKSNLWTAVNAATLPAKVTGVQALELEGHVQAAIIEMLLADDRL